MTDTWTYCDLSALTSPAVHAGHDYWRSKGPPPRLPGRSQIDPLEMRPFLPKILLIDVMADGGFVFRLCGGEIIDGNGRDLTGRRADEASLGASTPQFISAYRRTVETRQPLFFVGRMWWQDRTYAEFEQAILPLSADGLLIDKLFCIVDFEVRRQP